MMSYLKKKRHLFFDLDDTLWDFQKNSSLVLEQLFNEFELNRKLNTDFDTFLANYKRINLEFWSRYYKKQINKEYLRNHRFNCTFKEFGYDNYPENLVITEEYLGRAPKGNHLKEGCIDVLEYLKDNYNLHIITNGFKEVQHIKIDGCGLRPYFKNIIISEEHQLVKPEKEIFLLGEKLAAAQKNECVMIGDSFESDIEGALNAGWEAIHFNEKPIKPQIKTISKLSELKNLF
jgi:putative hydrolase of the HAD superfamily